MSEGLPPLGDVVALQDRDCIDRLKLRYMLAVPLPPVFFEQFLDARITLRKFSTIVPHGRDMFSIAKPSVFRADGIVSDHKVTVVFNGSPRSWPKQIVDDFGRRLIAVGYSTIAYRQNEPPRCADCAMRFVKGCRGAEGSPR